MQVPGVGEVFYTANPCMGLGERPLGAEFPAIPCPTRNYDGLEFTFKRRLQNNWMLNASFLYSRIFGTFSGLTSSDESGRNSPSVNRFYDGLYMSFNEKGEAIDGRLQSDRPWVVKIQPAYILPWGTMAGAEIDIEAGLPMTSAVTFTGVPVYVFGRNDLGNLPTYLLREPELPAGVPAAEEPAGNGGTQHRQPVRSGDGDGHLRDALPRRTELQSVLGRDGRGEPQLRGSRVLRRLRHESGDGRRERCRPQQRRTSRPPLQDGLGLAGRAAGAAPGAVLVLTARG